jgi:hypothetical protein
MSWEWDVEPHGCMRLLGLFVTRMVAAMRSGSGRVSRIYWKRGTNQPLRCRANDSSNHNHG